LTRNINSAGGQYEYKKRIGMGSSCIQGQWRINLSNLEANVNYEFNEEYHLFWIPKFE
jgi:hypothetical protein